MTKDTIVIICTVLLAAAGIIGINKADIGEVRADLRELRMQVAANTAAISELLGELRGLQNILSAHIVGHAHTTQVAATDGGEELEQ